MQLSDRIHGCLAGLALGDALGMPTEFLTPEQIAEEFGWVDSLMRAPSWHPHHAMRPGQITDDTGQTLAVAHAFGSDGKLSAAAVTRELLKWADAQGDTLALVLGPSTRKALDTLRQGLDPRETGKEGKTNGASYRAAVIGLVDHALPGKMIADVVEACLPTHGTTAAISGAMCVAGAVAEACREKTSLQRILDAARQSASEGGKHGNWVWSTSLEKRIVLAQRTAKENNSPREALRALYDYIGTDMSVPESVAAAFGVVCIAEGDPMKAIVYGANIGGDTDTVAAISGAVCGAWKGIEAIDRKMLAEVEKVNRLDLAAETSHLMQVIGRRN